MPFLSSTFEWVPYLLLIRSGCALIVTCNCVLSLQHITVPFILLIMHYVCLLLLVLLTCTLFTPHILTGVCILTLIRILIFIVIITLTDTAATRLIRR